MNKTFYTVSLAFCSISAIAQTPLDVQSVDRPFNLDIVGLVNQAGSDDESALFQQNALPGLQTFIDQNLGEKQALEDISAYAVNPEVLRLNTDSSIRIYFLGEGAGYHNSLAFSKNGGGITSESTLIFPDASSSASYLVDGSSPSNDYFRSENTPLLPGDFVDMGTYESGTSLDFLLIANGANGGTNVWSTDDNVNADGLQHAVAFAVEGSPYLLIGFEDLYGGGDKDYNDLLFVADIGAANVEFLSQPEPSTWILVIVLILYKYRKRVLRLSSKALHLEKYMS